MTNPNDLIRREAALAICRACERQNGPLTKRGATDYGKGLSSAGQAIASGINAIPAAHDTPEVLALMDMLAKEKIKREAAEALRDEYHGLFVHWRAEADGLREQLKAAEAALKEAVYVIEQLHGAVCGETGFASAVRMVSGIAYPWPALDAADEDARAFLTKHGSQK